ncbi:MAG: alpha/beta hydrolase [Bacillota bacterium]
MLIKSYEDVPIWDEIPKLLPEKNRINKINKPDEVFWNWGNSEIHLDYYKNTDSKVKVILLHGVGGNGRLLSFIGVPLHKHGYEVIAPDLPGYGISKISEVVSYQHWVQLVNDLIIFERQKDDRPVVLFGLSAGGMLAYHAACINKKVSGLIVTNILDQRVQEVRDGSAANKYISRIGVPVLTALSHINDRIKLPMKAIANMNAIVNNDRLLKLLIKDKNSSGASVPLRFLISLINAAPAIEPESFTICPLLMVHPEKDRWTPLKLSKLFYDRLKCQKHLVMLENAGHFPIENPGLEQLEQAVVSFLRTSQRTVP